MDMLQILFMSLVGTFSGPNQTLVHRVEPTKMVKSGHVTLKTGPDRGGKTMVNINYELKTTWYAPVGDQKGTESQSMPTKYLSDVGYREVEAAGSVRFEDVIITHLGRVNFDGHRNGHKVQIDKSGEWRAVAYFHPEIPATGWGRLTLTMYKVPVLGSYTINSQRQ